MKKTLLLLCSVFIAVFIAQGQPQTPVKVIFDSDMGPDYDDVGAIAMLHAFADEGKAEILATIASTKYPNVAAVFSVLNTYFNRPQLPIAVPKGNALELKDFQHWTDSLVANYPHSINSNGETPGAVELYRRILSGQPDGSVTIVTVGFLTNLAALMQSLPDEFSPLPGKELIAKKVKKLVSMAGRFPSGKEFNVDRDFTASKYVFDNWQTPVILSGFEIGEKIKCGLPLINNQSVVHSPVKDVFRISIPLAEEDKDGRKSWDETAVLVAVEGHEKFYTLQRGKMIVSGSDGSNTWVNDANGNHYYLVEKVPPAEVQQLIDKLMMHQPVKK
ncbi:nucleoside hydrolase [Foetidibacter luteolus]|uniref:nucleoside hydrolase n=1 Tax=Foetidibacter luteolus TaxID=2608880 RepID=UPI00129A770F|nr:nucleoside hydrolase [Foetidibacter luteolus]